MYDVCYCVQQRKADLERQKEFETTMMSGVSEERKEAMWTTAQQEAVSYQLRWPPH